MYSAVVVQEVCKGDKSLEDGESSNWPSEVDNDQLRAIIKADPFETTQEFAKELNINHSVIIWHIECVVQSERCKTKTNTT